LQRQFEAEISECFSFAKSSPFPREVDWAGLNLARTSPEADRLLAEVELQEFDAHQESTQAKGY
jgi:hypothetical protein